MFLEFAAGMRDYDCSPWSTVTFTPKGWKGPCYLIGEKYTDDWDEFWNGPTGSYWESRQDDRCQNCAMHSGFEASAVRGAAQEPTRHGRAWRPGTCWGEMTVLVTGGTGFVGAHLVRALLARGQQVRCLVRPASRLDNLDGLEVERVAGDLSDGAAVAARRRGLRGRLPLRRRLPALAREPDEIYRHNVDGTRNVLRAAAEADVRRVVYTSSVGALGIERDGQAANEATPVSLDDMVGHYKRSKFLAEREAEAWARRGLPVVIVNPSTPVGELDVKPTPTGQIIVDFLERRMPAYVDTGLNLVDVRDVAAGHVLAAERGGRARSTSSGTATSPSRSCSTGSRASRGSPRRGCGFPTGSRWPWPTSRRPSPGGWGGPRASRSRRCACRPGRCSSTPARRCASWACRRARSSRRWSGR